MKLQSYTITQGRDRAPARAMLKAIGFTDEDLAKPIIGVANTWIETMPCNYNLRELAVKVKEGIRAAGGTPMEFNTIAISDGVTMGTEGMKTSLVSREVIADSIELLVRGHMFDGVVALVACDKTIPGAAMALLRTNVPGLVLYGGSILPGKYKGHDISIGDVFEAVGANAAGRITDAELLDIEDHACPGAGACGGQFTANTMATVMELIGLCPMGMAAVPQVDKRKDEVACRCGQIIMDAVRNNLRPRDICTRAAFENAIASVAATGGSTNAVLHLLAMAREAEVPLSIDDFDAVCARTPIFVDLKPAGRFMAADVDKAGGIGVIAQRLLEGKFVDGSAITVTGRTLAEEAADARETPGQEVILPLNKALKPRGGIAILRGSLAPEGCVIKLAGHEKKVHHGPARVFDREEDAMEAVTHGTHQAQRRGDHPLRRPARRPGHARDARRDRRDRGRRPFRQRGAGDRRPFQRRHPRLHDRPRGPRGLQRRPHRRRAGRRPDHGGCRQGRDRYRHSRRRAGPAPGRLEAPRPALQDRRLRQVLRAGLFGLRRRHHAPFTDH